MYLLLDTDNTYTVVDSLTSLTTSSRWWTSPSTAVQKYFDDRRAVVILRGCYDRAEVIAHFTDVKSYDDFLLLYPEFQI